METSAIVQREKDNFDTSLYYRNIMTKEEQIMAHGRYFFPAVFALYISNGILLAHKYGFGNNAKIGAAFWLTALPICGYITAIGFGDARLRRVYLNERDNEISARFYEQNKH
jgi:hypothetical protein